MPEARALKLDGGQTSFAETNQLFSIMLLIAALLAQTFASGRLAFTPAVWLAPFFLLVFLDHLPRWRSLVLVFCVILVAFLLQWRGYIPAPLPIYIAVAFGYAFALTLPYVAHLFSLSVRGRLDGSAVLAFPAAMVVVEWLTRSFSPYGSWGAIGYALPRSEPLLQLGSVFGLAAPAIAVCGFAAIAALVLRGGLSITQNRRMLGAFAVIALVAWSWGAWRARTALPTQTSVAVSTVFVPISDKSIIFGEVDWAGQVGKPISNTDQVFLDLYLLNKIVPEPLEAEVRAWFVAKQDALFAASEREAALGSKLIVWSEGNGVVLFDQEGAFIQRGQTFAKDHGVVLVMTLNTKRIGERLSENKALIIDADGALRTSFLKARPVPGSENSVAGTGIIEVVSTAVGRIAGVICFDADHPEFMRQAAKLGAELLVVPSYDWVDISPYHTEMAAWRASELGIPMVRSASSGQSAVFDAKGRLIASSNSFGSDAPAMRSRVPIGRIETLFSKYGDAGIGGLALLLLVFLFMRRQQSSVSTSAS
jgi:apolipoprotein N-acyltransferase